MLGKWLITQASPARLSSDAVCLAVAMGFNAFAPAEVARILVENPQRTSTKSPAIFPRILAIGRCSMRSCPISLEDVKANLNKFDWFPCRLARVFTCAIVVLAAAGQTSAEDGPSTSKAAIRTIGS